MKILNEDITKQKDGLIIHGVNCRGVMGSGVALAIKNTWKPVYKRYKEVFDTFQVSGCTEQLLGHLDVIQITPKLHVGNGYTQKNYGKDGKRYASLVSVENVLLEAFKHAYKNSLSLKTVKIGCGLGGLSWENEVHPIIELLEIEYPKVNVQIFEI